MKRLLIILSLLLMACPYGWASESVQTIVVGQPTAAAGGTPTLSSATIPTTGKTVSLVFSEAVSVGAGGNGGIVLSPSETGVSAVATYASGSGTTTLVYNLDRYIASSETATIAYTQPGNGIEATTGGGDVANFSGTSVTVSSTVPRPDVYYKCEDNAANATLTAANGSNGSYYNAGAGSDDSADNTSTTHFKGDRSFSPVDTQAFLGVAATGASIEDGVFTIQFSYFGDNTTGWGSGAWIRMFKDSDNDSFCLMANDTSSTSFLFYTAGTEYAVTLDEVNTGTWQVIRVVMDTGAEADKIRIYQGATEATLALKYESNATAVTAPTLTSEGFLMFGSGVSNRGIQVRNGKADEVKIWYTAVVP